MTHLVLFDIDGTLLLTGGAGREAFNRVFVELYNEADIWQNVVPDGRTDDSLVDEVYRKRFGRAPSPSEHQKIAARYNEVMAEEIPRSARFRLMPFATEVVKTIHAQPHFLLGLATGNYETAAWHKLRHAGLDSYFEFGGFGSDSIERVELTKKAILRGQDRAKSPIHSITLVGDSIHDVSAGKANDAHVIAVTTGSTPAHELKAAGASEVLENLEALPRLLGII